MSSSRRAEDAESGDEATTELVTRLLNRDGLAASPEECEELAQVYAGARRSAELVISACVEEGL